MKIYNTMTRKKEEFVPLREGRAGIYVCGPTVYSFIHIGNARPPVVFDALRRYLKYKGYETTYVQNFTDVNDKIIVRANDEGISPADYARRFIGEALEDMRGLGAADADFMPKVSEEIGEIVNMIAALIEKDYAYAAENGDVFYDVTKKADYGKLSRKNLEELEAGARIEVDERKRSPTDFALWKSAKPGEPFWPSPWGNGRPGWHIECSAMSKKYLSDTFDIHAGGDDLIFPHHENEIAQSEAANGAPFARYWMHNALVNTENRKMSKSEGNVYNVRQLAKDYSYDAIRFFLLNAHYRSPINFSPELLRSAQSALGRIQTGAALLAEALAESRAAGLLPGEEAVLAKADEFLKSFEDCMDDDLNTADAIAVIFDAVKYANVNLSAKNSKPCLDGFLGTILLMCDILGLKTAGQEPASPDKDLGAEIERLIAARQEARQARNFAEADRIRDELSEMGVAIEDKPEGARWTIRKK